MIILIFLYFYSILRVMISDQHTLYDSGKTPPTLSNLLFKDHINLKLSYDEDMLKELYTFFVQLLILALVHATILEIARTSCLCWLKFCIIFYAQLNSQDSSVA